MALGTNAGGEKKQRHFTKTHWTPKEDAVLIDLVQRCGPGNWDYIARHFKGRNGKSCRLRWTNQLSPDVNKSQFSLEELQRLLLLQKRYGNRWSIIAKVFPGRTDNQLKNQFNVLMGTYKKTTGSKSSGSHSPATPKGGPIGNFYRGFAPVSAAMPVNVPKPPFPIDPSAVVYGNAGIWNQNNSCHMRNNGNPRMFDANSVAFPGICLTDQTVKEPLFFDFMGVGTSE